MVSTLIVPRVGDKTAVLASFGASAEDPHGVATQLRDVDIMIHTSDGTVLHHVLLDSLYGAEAVW